MSLLSTRSRDCVEATVDRLVTALERRQIEVFARIDHGGAARRAGLELADEEVLIFGDPRVGTLLMQADPAVGYELPLRMLVRAAEGTATISYRPVRELADSYELARRADVLERIEALLAALAEEAAAAG
jgi:uncharacterized protein (DUF302 family)